MDRAYPVGMDPMRVPSPCFVVFENAIRNNMAILADVKRRTGCRILLALKAFSMFGAFPLIRDTLDGTCASSPNEARLGREEFGKEVHVFAPAYSQADFDTLLGLCDHIVFNSFSQWAALRPSALRSARPVNFGMRINPEHSETEVALYDPCAPFSRLGVTRSRFDTGALDGISGLHFHTLCEKDAPALERTLKAVEDKFGDIIPGMKWVNFGGGHHITRPGYDVGLLCRLVDDFKRRWKVEVYLEPGEAAALNAGILVTTVLDVISNGMDIAILDVSATAHMPDVLEMPYRPPLAGSGLPGEKSHTYRLGGVSCLAGDVIGDYSFDHPLRPGDRLVFGDMAHYSMVKTTMFNGVQHPSIALFNEDTDTVRVLRRFGYEDFKSRLS